MRFEATSPELDSRIARLLKIVADQKDAPGGGSPSVQPSEFPVPESADLPLGCEGITPEAAPAILAKIIERVQETGALTEQELMEIVKAGQ